MSYASVDELSRVLGITTPTAAQLVAMQRVLDAAQTEIDADLGRGIGGVPEPYPDGEAPALVVEVNIERAAEHWAQQEVHFGIVQAGSEAPPAHMARDTFDRHSRKLDALRVHMGFA